MCCFRLRTHSAHREPHTGGLHDLRQQELSTNTGKNDAPAAMLTPMWIPRGILQSEQRPGAAPIHGHTPPQGACAPTSRNRICANRGAYVHTVRRASSAFYATEGSSTCPPKLGAGAAHTGTAGTRLVCTLPP